MINITKSPTIEVVPIYIATLKMKVPVLPLTMMQQCCISLLDKIFMNLMLLNFHLFVFTVIVTFSRGTLEKVIILLCQCSHYFSVHTTN